MVTQINLGSFFQSNGKNVITGGSSGLDVKTLVDDLVKAKQISVTQVQDKVDANTKSITAFSDFKTKLTALQTAVNFLRNPPGVNQDANNIFKYLTVNMTGTNGITPANYISVSAAPGTDPRTSSIQVTGVAQTKIQTSGTISVADADTAIVAASSTAGMFTAGVMEINNGQTITLATGDTLNDIAAKMNAISTDSGVKATVVKVGTGQYALQFKATTTGTAADFDVMTAANTAPGGPLENISFGNTQPAADASIVVDGVTITSQSNVISDAISGITFTVKQKTNGETITADIVPDTSTVKSSVQNFINAYNDLKVFAAEQNQRDDSGKLLDTAVLGSNHALTTVMNSIDDQLNKIVGGLTAGNPNRLSDVGITFTDYPGDDKTPEVKNVLTLDENKFDTALATNFDAFRRVFEFDLSSDNPAIAIYSSNNNVSINNFSLNVDTVGGTAQATYTDASGSHTIDLDYSAYGTGAILKGQSGTALDGLQLIYASTNSSTSNVTLYDGIAAGVYNAVGDATDASSGIITAEVNGLNDSNKRLNDDITNMQTQIDSYRQTLMDKFSAMEQAISMVNTLLQTLDANSKALYASATG